MKNRISWKYLLVGCLISVIFSCESDDTYNGPSPNKITAVYSNKLSNLVTANQLSLTYSGRELIGKEVSFETEDANTGTLTLSYVFPNDGATVLKDISLKPNGEGTAYTFSGNATSGKGVTFAYEGTIKEGSLLLALTNINVPQNTLITNQSLTTVKNAQTVFTTERINGKRVSSYTYTNTVYTNISGELMGVLNSQFLKPVLCSFMHLCLDKIKFLPDGNIVADYRGLPDKLVLGDLIPAIENIPTTPAQTSPINLANYCFIDDTSMYVLPQIDMIISQIRADKTKAENGFNINWSNFTELYSLLNEWSTTGIRLIVKENPWKEFVSREVGSTINRTRYIGDHLLYIDKEDLKKVMKLIDIVKDLLPTTWLEIPLTELLAEFGSDLPEDITQLLPADVTLAHLITIIEMDLIENPFQIGLFLTKE